MSRKYLTAKEETRIKHAVEERVMHFSPTISPAPKSVERNEIESLEEAIKYYREAGEKQVIIQPKYMGSYCDIYLHYDIEKTKFFSRKGYPIPSFVDRKQLIDAVRPIWEKFKSEWTLGDLDLVIVQAELMPWSALGKGLISREFRGYQQCHQFYCDYIKNTGLNSVVQSAKEDQQYALFMEDSNNLSAKDLKEKYPSHVVKHYQALMALSIRPVDEYQNAINVYSQQVDLYGADGDMHFKSFNWLKMVFSNGEEAFNESNISGFTKVSDDDYIVFDLDTEDDLFQYQMIAAYKKFDDWISNQKMEGVIVKPDTVWNKDVAPMLKVRNPQYLQMIYGVNFLSDFEYYFERRGIKKKIRCSINEWNIAQSLLRIPMKEISPHNEEYVKWVSARILEEDFEKTLDGRL